jgi:hypothetical protein
MLCLFLSFSWHCSCLVLLYLYSCTCAIFLTHHQFRGCTNPGRQLSRVTKFCTVAPNICGSLRMELVSCHSGDA